MCDSTVGRLEPESKRKEECAHRIHGRTLCSTVACLLALLASELAHGQIACEYEIVATIQGPNCGVVGIRGLTPTAISPNGLYVTGWHGQCEINDDAFIWIGPPPGTRITIPRPPGIEHAKGYDVNDSGVVTGMCHQSNAMRGFVWKYESGQWITLEPPMPGGEVQPSAINNANTVVGYRSIRDNNVPREAFIWNESTGFQGLGVMIGPSSGATDISENGIVVGWTGAQSGSHTSIGIRAFVWENENSTVLGPVPGGINSLAVSVSESGQVAGYGKTQSSPVSLYSSFLYDDGTMNLLSTPEGFDRTFPSQVISVGLVVGSTSDSSTGGVAHSCSWQGTQVALLENLVTNASQWNLNQEHGATGSSEVGDILLIGRTFPNLPVGFILKPVAGHPGDSNCDVRVDVDDLLNVINSWGVCPGCPADFNQSGTVDIDDLLTVISQWSQ